MDEDLLREQLEAGCSLEEAAERWRVSVFTIKRRVNAARKEHGPGWGTPPTPTSSADAADVDESGDAPTLEALRERAHRVMDAAMRGRKVPANAINAARTILTMPPSDGPDPNKGATADHATAVENLRALAAAVRGEPEPAALTN